MTQLEPRDQVILTVMVLMTLADGRVVDDEVARIRWILGKLTDAPVSEAVARAAIAQIRADELEIDAYLARVGPDLDADTKRRLLTAAFAIASADGRVLDAEDEMLVGIARTLGVSPVEYNALLSHMNVTRDFD